MPKESQGPPDEVPGYIVDITRHLPSDWDDPRARVVRLLVEQSGVLPQMGHRNPELIPRITDFFVGNKNILIIAGESGMGKSLLTGELRRMHGDLAHVLPEDQRTTLCVSSWDRTHQAFFEQISTEVEKQLCFQKEKLTFMREDSFPLFSKIRYDSPEPMFQAR